MSNAHTPGPWKAFDSGDTQWTVRSGKQFICNTLHANDKANARLIAAAPELAGALHDLLQRLNVCDEEGAPLVDATAERDRAHVVLARLEEDQ